MHAWLILALAFYPQCHRKLLEGRALPRSRPNRLYKECSVIGNELKKYGHRLVNLKKTNRFAVIADNASLTGLNEFKLNNGSDSITIPFSDGFAMPCI